MYIRPYTFYFGWIIRDTHPKCKCKFALTPFTLYESSAMHIQSVKCKFALIPFTLDESSAIHIQSVKCKFALKPFTLNESSAIHIQSVKCKSDLTPSTLDESSAIHIQSVKFNSPLARFTLSLKRTDNCAVISVSVRNNLWYQASCAAILYPIDLMLKYSDSISHTLHPPYGLPLSPSWLSNNL